MSRRKTRPLEALAFGSVVRRMREAHGWTQEELAERAGMNAAYVGFVERGDNVPTLTMIIQIARAVGVDPAELVRDTVRSL